MSDNEHAIPKAAIWRGKKVRVLYYFSKNNFMVLDHTDTTRLIPRSQLTFVK